MATHPPLAPGSAGGAAARGRPPAKPGAIGRVRVATAAALLLCLAATTAPTTPLDAELARLDALAAQSTAVSADFRQEKVTPLLRHPLVSTGHVASRGDVSLWSTQQPRPSTMRVTPTEIRLYYPQQHAEEIYPVQGQLGTLAASPLPRLATLKQFFAFAQQPSTDPATATFKLTPIADDLKQHVTEVDVTLDRATGAVRRAETVDPDGDRTVLTFDHVDLHAKTTDADLALAVPAGTTVTHPLAGVGGPTK